MYESTNPSPTTLGTTPLRPSHPFATHPQPNPSQPNPSHPIPSQPNPSQPNQSLEKCLLIKKACGVPDGLG